jgi:broad-specificity NMP kinase
VFITGLPGTGRAENTS